MIESIQLYDDPNYEGYVQILQEALEELEGTVLNEEGMIKILDYIDRKVSERISRNEWFVDHIFPGDRLFRFAGVKISQDTFNSNKVNVYPEWEFIKRF